MINNKMKKKNGFTLIELVIALAITVVIIGVVYTFGIVNQKSLANAEIKSTLQNEGNSFQKELITIGTQAKNITKLSGTTAGGIVFTDKPATVTPYSDVDTTDNKNSIELSKLELCVFNDANDLTKKDYYTYYLVDGPKGPSDEKLLYLKNNSDAGKGKLISSNVQSFTVTPLDYQSAKGVDPTFVKTFFSTATGIRVTLVMHIKSGYNDVTYPVTTLVNFRNINAGP